MVEILKVNDRGEILRFNDKRGKMYWLSFVRLDENKKKVAVVILRNIRRRPSIVFFEVYDPFSIDEFISDLKDAGLHPLVEILGTVQIEPMGDSYRLLGRYLTPQAEAIGGGVQQSLGLVQMSE